MEGITKYTFHPYSQREIHPRSAESQKIFYHRRSNPSSRENLLPGSGYSSPVPGRKRARRSPAVYLLLQLILLSFVWIWYMVATYKSIILPDTAAAFIKGSPEISTFLVTGTSIILSTAMSFGLSRSIMLLLTQSLAESTSLFTLTAAIHVARGSFVIRSTRISWSLVTVVISVLLAMLTASFAALLTPKVVIVSKQIFGTEFDLASPASNDFLYFQMFYLWHNDTYNARTTAMGAVIDAAAIPAVSTSSGRFGAVSLNGASWNISTGGTMALGPAGSGAADAIVVPDVDLDGYTANGRVPKRYHIEGNPTLPRGFLSSYTIDQQGFSADISCQRRNLTEPNLPSLSGAHGIIPLPESMYVGTPRGWYPTTSLYNWTWVETCPLGGKGNAANVLMIPPNTHSDGSDNGVGQIAGQFCYNQDISGEASNSTHLLLLAPLGPTYSWFPQTLCSVTFKMTKIRADYTPTGVNISQVLDTSAIFPRAKAPTDALKNIYLQISRQNLDSNVFGDRIASMYFDHPESLESDDEKQAALNQILEDYFRGVVEVSATWIRNSASLQGVFQDDIFPPNMSIPFNGTWRYETIGWETSSNRYTPFVVLVPITSVAFLSIGLLILYWMQEGAGLEGVETTLERADGDPIEFDPTDTMHLLLVTAARGGSGQPLLYPTDTIDRIENMHVRLRDDMQYGQLALLRVNRSSE